MNNTKSYYTFSGVVLLTFNQNSSVLNIKKNTNIKCTSLADPGAPPLTAADIWFFCMPKTPVFSKVASLASQMISLIEIWPEHAKNDFYLNLQHFQ